jgi:glycosyltransferase 2 family protein
MSRWAKLGLLAIALGFCAYGLATQRHDVTAALRSLSVGSVIGSIAAAIAGMACMMLSWRTLLRDLGSPLSLRSAIRVLFIAQLGKYVPGAVWATAAQVELGRGHQIPRQNSAVAATVSMLVSLATGLLVAAVALPLSSGHAVRTYWWAFALAPLALIALYPPLTAFFLNLALRVLRRPPLERHISGAGLSRAVGWSLAGWALYSVHMWLLVADVTGKAASVLLISAGAYALAWSVGFILIPFPGGVGPREAALTVVLAPVMPAGSAFAVAVVSRLVMTIADLAWAGVAFLLSRSALRDRGRPAPSGQIPDPAEPAQDSQIPDPAQPSLGNGLDTSLPLPTQRTSG